MFFRVDMSTYISLTKFIECEDCAKKFGETKTSEMIEEFGKENKEAFESGVKIVSNKKQP
jgi:hypothetical protein